MVQVRSSIAVNHHVEKFLDNFDFLPYTVENFDKKSLFPTTFFGLYTLNDYMALRFHRGPCLIFWLGTDVTILLEGLGPYGTGYFQGLIKSKNAIHICQNELLRQELESVGIDAQVRPLFMASLDTFTTCYKYKKRPSVYTMVSSNKYEFYGIPWIYEIADQADVDFYIYGYEGEDTSNVFHFPYLPEDKFNEQIKEHQAFLRLPEHDGISQSTMKAILMGQYVCDRIEYPFTEHVTSPQEVLEFVNSLYLRQLPNDLSELMKKSINNFDWLVTFKETYEHLMIEEEDEW